MVLTYMSSLHKRDFACLEVEVDLLLRCQYVWVLQTALGVLLFGFSCCMYRPCRFLMELFISHLVHDWEDLAASAKHLIRRAVLKLARQAVELL